MRIGVGDEFLRTTGGTLTGPLTISANAAELLLLNRPDGAAHSPIASQRAGVTDYLLRNLAAEPFLALADAAAASRLTLNMATGAIGVATITPAQAAALALAGGTLTGPLAISANGVPLLSLNRADGLGSALIRFLEAGVPRVDVSSSNVQPFFRVSDPAVLDVLTVRTDTGLLGAGLIPLSMLRVDEQRAGNAGVVTVLAATTTIANLASMNVTAGDRILVSGHASVLKGATTGKTTIFAGYGSGTATLTQFLNGRPVSSGRSQINATTEEFWFSGWLFVTGSGTLVLTLNGTSAGSNGTIAIADGQLSALVLRG